MNSDIALEREALESLVARVADDYLQRQRHGEQPDVEEYAARHPEHAAVLREVLTALKIVGLTAPGATFPPNDTFQPQELGTLGDYRIIREVGRGGMGVVYEAEQISLGRRVALKVLPFAATMDPKHLQRFHNEARAAASLHHEHIVPVYGVGCERSVHFYAMQFIEGTTLARIIAEMNNDLTAEKKIPPRSQALLGNAGLEAPLPVQRETPVEREAGLRKSRSRADLGKEGVSFSAPSAVNSPGDPTIAYPPPEPATTTAPIAVASTLTAPRDKAFFRRVAELGIQAAEALEFAHSLGVVHRDVKPGNLMLDAQCKLWVTDFGLARTAADAGMTMSGDLLGTLRYMSPEQALARHGLVDHRTDIYALGATLYELLTGRPVVIGEDKQELLRQIAFEEPVAPRTLNPAMSNELETILLKTLGKNPTNRYASARDLADDLQRYLDQRPIRARRPGLSERIQKWVRRHKTAVVTGGVAALLPLLLAVASLAASAVLISHQHADAVREKNSALEQRDLAWAREREVRRHLYAADIKRARQAWQNGDIPGVLQLLAAHEPAPDGEDLRGFEWYYLRGLCHKDRRTLGPHPAEVWYLAYSPDGKSLATVSGDAARIWDTATGRLLATLSGHPKGAHWVCFSLDGKTLATTGGDGVVRLWDVDSQKIVREIARTGQFVLGVAFLPNNRLLAATVQPPVFSLWDPDTLEELGSFPFPAAHPLDLQRSPDGTLLAIAGDSKAVLYDLATKKVRATLTGHSRTISSLNFSADGKMLATASADNTVRIWDTTTGAWGSLRAHTSVVQGVAFSPDGRALASCGNDASVRVWDLKTRTEVSVLLGHTKRVWKVRFSPDGKTLASCSDDGTAKLWPAQPMPEWTSFQKDQSPVTYVAYSPDATKLVTGSRTPAISVWDVGSKTRLRVFDAANESRSDWYLTEDGKSLVTLEPLRVIPFWDTIMRSPTSHTTLGLLAGQNAMSPDGRTLAAFDGTIHAERIHFWNVETRQSLASGPVGLRNAQCMTFAPDGQAVLVGDLQGGIWRCNLTTRESRDTAMGHREMVTGLVFSPNGRIIASCCGPDQTVKLWNADTYQLRATLQHNSVRTLSNVSFSPDGKTMATCGGNRVFLWHVATGQELFTLEIDRAGLCAVAFSPDGQTLTAVGTQPDGNAGEIYMWSTQGNER